MAIGEVGALYTRQVSVPFLQSSHLNSVKCSPFLNINNFLYESGSQEQMSYLTGRLLTGASNSRVSAFLLRPVVDVTFRLNHNFARSSVLSFRHQ